MTDADSDRFDMIARGVRTLSFPTDREALVAAAREAGETELAVELRSLPEGARYDSLDALLLAMGVGSAGRIDVPGAPPRDPYQRGATGDVDGSAS